MALPYSAEDCATHNPDKQNNKYNGKEFDTTLSLNTYDYGARQYNSLVGRWDRRAERLAVLAQMQQLTNDKLGVNRSTGKVIVRAEELETTGLMGNCKYSENKLREEQGLNIRIKY